VASSLYNGNLTADRASDGNDNTWWVGGSGKTSWTLTYTFTQAIPLTMVTVSYHDASYVPAGTKLQFSGDGGQTWTDIGTAALA